MALASADPSSSTIRLLPGVYGVPLAIASGTVTLVGTGAQLQGRTGDKVLNVGGGATVTVRGLDIDLSREDAWCNGASGFTRLNLDDLKITIPLPFVFLITKCATTLRRVTISTDAGPFLIGDDGVVDADRVRLIGNMRAAGISTMGKRMRLTLTNSVLDNVIVAFGQMDDASTRSNYVVAYNTILVRDYEYGAIRGCTFGDNQNKSATIENNIVVSTLGSSVIDGAYCAIANNILWPQAITVPGTNMIVDPRLVNPAAHDLGIKADSPAVNAGVISAGPNFTHDFLGTARPQGPKPDIGAYELKP